MEINLAQESIQPVRQGAVSERGEIFGKLQNDFERGAFPWIGNYKDFALGYITISSTLHAFVDSPARPIGSFVIGSSSSGKSQFLETLCNLFPDEMIINLTTASPRSFIYQCKNDPYFLNGKVVFVEELSGLKDEEVQYLLRTLITKGKSRHTTVAGGEVQAIDIVGGISLQSTGLKQDILREDTMNRMVLFKSDDSNAMTEKVVENIKNRYMASMTSVSVSSPSQYQSFFRSLKPYKVAIHYADRIQFKITNTENRRLTKILMDLLATVALINQKERMIIDDTVISDTQDFAILFDLVTEKISDQINLKLNRCEKAVYDTILGLKYDDFFDLKDISSAKPGFVEGRFKGYGLTSIKMATSTLSEMGLLEAAKVGKKLHFKMKKNSSENYWGVIGLRD